MNTCCVNFLSNQVIRRRRRKIFDDWKIHTEHNFIHLFEKLNAAVVEAKKFPVKHTVKMYFFPNIPRLQVVFILHATANKNNNLAEPCCSFSDC